MYVYTAIHTLRSIFSHANPVSLSLFLSVSDISVTPKIFVQYAMGSMSLETFVQKNKRPARKVKVGPVGLFLFLQEWGIPEEQQGNQQQKQKKFKKIKGRPRYALAVS